MLSSRIVSRVNSSFRAVSGRLAQLVARFLHTEEVIGSSPVSPTDVPDRPGLDGTTVIGTFSIACVTCDSDSATTDPDK